jgi:hypothetical protein
MALNDVSCPYEHLVIGDFGVCKFQPSVETGRKNVDKNIDKHNKQ